jgi:hypothetical protein
MNTKNDLIVSIFMNPLNKIWCLVREVNVNNINDRGILSAKHLL